MPRVTRSIWGLSDFDPDQPSDLDPLREWLLDRWCTEHRHFQCHHDDGHCAQGGNSDPAIHAAFDTTIAEQARNGYLAEDELAQLELPTDVEEGLLLFVALDQETRDEFYYSARRSLPMLGSLQAFARGVHEQLRWLGFTLNSTTELIRITGGGYALQAIEYAADVCPYVKGSVEAVHLLLGRLWESHLEATEIVYALRGLGLPVPNAGSVNNLIKVLKGMHYAVAISDQGIHGYRRGGQQASEEADPYQEGGDIQQLGTEQDPQAAELSGS